jgi:GMP synthase (glutamine-hydrolysing)
LELDLRSAPRLPDPRELAACIVAGSPHSVTERAPWMLKSETYLRDARALGTALFGICFGHQILASALGGRVSLNPKGREMGLCLAEPLCSNTELCWPAEALEVLMSHGDTVVSLPPGAHVLAKTDREAHAAIDYGNLCISTQFHPEFTPSVLRCYIEHYRPQMQAQGDDVEGLIARLRETPRAQALLRRFIQLALERDQNRIRRCAS